MTDNLGLEALVRIQALDARNAVDDFREERTLGGPLDEADATSWMRAKLGAPSEAVMFGLHLEHHLDPSRKRWRDQGGIWRASTGAGEEVGQYPTDKGSAMRELGSLVCAFGEAFGREWLADGALFVLADRLPRLKAASFLGKRNRQEGGLRNVSGPLSEELVLFVRPQATLADVTAEYQRAQRRLAGLPPSVRERIKPIGSPRVRDLAVLGARIARGEFANWATAMACYNAEHSAETNADNNEYDDAYRKSKTDRTDDPSKIRRFRKDVREAYLRVTGLSIDWQPARRGGLPEAVADIGGESVRIPTAYNALPVVHLGSEEELQVALTFARKLKAEESAGP